MYQSTRLILVCKYVYMLSGIVCAFLFWLTADIYCLHLMFWFLVIGELSDIQAQCITMRRTIDRVQHIITEDSDAPRDVNVI